MAVMREAWTDERLDELNRRFDHLQVTLVAGLIGLIALQLT